MTETHKARLVGVNHVALEVGDLDAALDFYDSLFAYELRGRSEGHAFVDMGDQFIALAEVDDPDGRDDGRHFGLVVDDIEAVERALDEQGVERPESSGVEFYDPWGNRIQVVAYEAVQFTKAEHVLAGMDLDLEKSEDALSELAEKGMAPDRE